MSLDFNITLPTSEVATVVEDSPSLPLRRDILTQIEDSNEYLMIIDNSSMEKFVTCPTAAMFYLVYKREAHARNAALVFGGAIHHGLESYYKGEDEATQNEAIVKHFLSNPTPADDHRNPAVALEVMSHYRKRCVLPDYDMEVLSHDGSPLIETPFELPLCVIEVNSKIHLPSWDSPRFVSFIHVAWSGKIDLCVSANSRHRICDHKTTSIAGDQFVQDFKLSNQTIGYLWAGQQLWPDLDLTGFMGNAIHLKRPTSGRGYSGSLTDRGPRGGDPALNFFRFYFEYSSERVCEWEENAKLLVSDFIHCLTRSAFPAHTKWCFGKYGRCPYHDACSIDDQRVRLNMINSPLFKPVTWDPTL